MLKDFITSSLTLFINENVNHKAYIMTGLPGSGKSTWIKNNLENVTIISKDLIRQEMGIMSNQDDKAIGDAKQEKEVKRKHNELLNKALKCGEDVVLDNTNIGKSRIQLLDILRKANYFIIGVNIRTPLDVCLKRRENCVPEKVMKQMNKDLKFLTTKECDKVIDVK